MADALHVLVDRTDISRTRIDHTPTLEPAMGEVLVRVDRVALTSNNVTYAVVADRIPYFEFFPAPPGWGRVPVWGFGDVVISHAPHVEPQERLYGFWPMSTHVTLRPERVTERTFFDGFEHRRTLPAAYNSYSRVARDETYDEYDEPRIALFRPLFLTALVLDIFLAEENHFGATQIVVSSASSKTASILAQRLTQRDNMRAIGMTSSANVAFVESLGLFDQVLTPDRVEDVPQAPTIYVDFSGSGSLRESLRRHLVAKLAYDCAVGVADWKAQHAPSDWQGVAPEVFFAPAQYIRMLEAHGAPTFWKEYADAWQAFRAVSRDWYQIIELNGVEALEDTYRRFARGEVNPAKGMIIRP